MSELHRTAQAILIPLDQWAAMVAFMNETASLAAKFADYGIERLDDLAGDPDCEDADADEDDDPREDEDPAGQYDEDGVTGPLPFYTGPGCPISDPGEYEDAGE